jgi:protein-tyrosine phosphatase
MIDLRCHNLPAVEDPAASVAVADGVSVLACTPHILPRMYHNTGPQIQSATQQPQNALDQEGIPLRLVPGADVHLVPDLVEGGRILSLAGSRYVPVEPPHHTAPPHLGGFFFNLLVAGSILAHPERLTWVPQRYEGIQRAVRGGVWMQITSGSLTDAKERADNEPKTSFVSDGQCWKDRAWSRVCWLWLTEPMIDLHSHILPGIDDGAADLGVALEMAEAWVADGVSVLACTPHILPGLYHNTGPQIRRATQELQNALDQEGIPLRLVTGADNHVVPDFVAGLQSGRLLSLCDSRYVLVEPPHHTEPPRLEDFFFSLLVAGYVPILTHPERLTWVPSRYDSIQRLVQAGVWMQITSGSLTGAFGRTAQYWAERMLEEGCVHILATDAHDCERRPPKLSRGRDFAARRVGAEEAEHLVLTRPRGVIANELPSNLPMPASVDASMRGTGDVEADLRNGANRQKDGRGRTGSSQDRSGGVRGLVGRLRHFLG